METFEDVVVLPHGELAAGQRPRAVVAAPGAESAAVGPGTHDFVARRVIDLENGLRPAAFRVTRFFPLPGRVSGVGVDFRVLPGPVLPPMFHDVGAVGLAFLVFENHDQAVLEGDPVTVVLEDGDVLGAPGKVGARRLIIVGEAEGLDEIEADTVFASEGEDRAAVFLLGSESRFLQSGPRRLGRGGEGDLGAGGGAAAGVHFLRRDEGPGEVVTAGGGLRAEREC